MDKKKRKTTLLIRCTMFNVSSFPSPFHDYHCIYVKLCHEKCNSQCMFLSSLL